MWLNTLHFWQQYSQSAFNNDDVFGSQYLMPLTGSDIMTEYVCGGIKDLMWDQGLSCQPVPSALIEISFQMTYCAEATDKCPSAPSRKSSWTAWLGIQNMEREKKAINLSTILFPLMFSDNMRKQNTHYLICFWMCKWVNIFLSFVL